MELVHYAEGINGTPAIPLVLKAWSELINNGWSRTYLPLDDEYNKAFVIFNNKTPIALILFRLIDVDPLADEYAYFIETGYIEPMHRKDGLYSILWNKLVEYAKLNNVGYISSWIQPSNTKMLEIAKKQGREFREIEDDGTKLIETIYKIK